MAWRKLRMNEEKLDYFSDDWSDIGAAHQSLHGAVTDSLRVAILEGRFKPGERLTESGLADKLKVSRNPIREALRALHVEGLVDISPRKGARVRSISEDEIAEIIDLRAELEGINARNAARRCSAAMRGSMQSLLDAGNKAAIEGDAAELKKLNNTYHTLLADAGCNRYLADYVRTLRQKTLWLFSPDRGERSESTWKDHAEILQAVIAADVELSALLASRHVRRIGEIVHSLFRLEAGRQLE